MRIGIDASCWANRRGFGRFTRCLVNEMTATGDHDWVLLIDAVSAADPTLPSLPADVEVVTVPATASSVRAAGAASGRQVRDLARMSAAARRAKAAAFFFPASYSFFPVIGTPYVVTVHDAIAERLPGLTLPSVGDRARWWLKQQVAVRRATAVVTVSEASRRAIIAELPVPADRLHVIREAPAPHFRPIPDDERQPLLRRLGLDASPYILYVGGISPHKNIERLVDAFDLLARDHPDVRLVLAGDTTDDPFLSSTGDVRRAVAASNAHDRIVMTGFVSEDELVALYSGAVATALPSLLEGFGLTGAESAACGTPVVASRDEALEELLGEAGVYADAHDTPAWASALAELVSRPAWRADRSKAVLHRASTWSWPRAAEQTTAILESAARRG